MSAAQGMERSDISVGDYLIESLGVCGCCEDGDDAVGQQMSRSYFSVAKMELGELVYEDADGCGEPLHSLARKHFSSNNDCREREKQIAASRFDSAPPRLSISVANAEALRQQISSESARHEDERKLTHPSPVSFEFSQGNKRCGRVKGAEEQLRKTVAWEDVEWREIEQRKRPSSKGGSRRSSLLRNSSLRNSSLRFSFVRLFFRAR
uniref:Uncharacterized protein n=1 Tax=Erythrolobus madagascarensis TaxID=708628 RepID=A0A7S0XI48_9RHOD|mmetsp:Transcript_2825/g.6165  ORF Transcript_2825/g.6165 Transcript_2825/m.6165 type:complete len:208 (+) Transcript_2825:3-626(+)